MSMTDELVEKEFIYCKSKTNEVRVFAIDKATAKAKIQKIVDDRMDEMFRKMELHDQYERDFEQNRIDNLDWKSAYYEALEALRFYNPLLADKIDNEMK